MMNPLMLPFVKSKIPITSIIKNMMSEKGISIDLKIAFIKLIDQESNRKPTSFYSIVTCYKKSSFNFPFIIFLLNHNSFLVQSLGLFIGCHLNQVSDRHSHSKGP